MHHLHLLARGSWSETTINAVRSRLCLMMPKDSTREWATTDVIIPVHNGTAPLLPLGLFLKKVQFWRLRHECRWILSPGESRGVIMMRHRWVMTCTTAMMALAV